jgi:hypothetical protein
MLQKLPFEKPEKLISGKKVCLTPSHIQGGLLRPQTMKRLLYPQSFQNQPNYPQEVFGRWRYSTNGIVTVMAALLQ